MLLLLWPGSAMSEPEEKPRSTSVPEPSWARRARLQVGLDVQTPLIVGRAHVAAAPTPQLLLGATFAYGIFDAGFPV